MCKGSCKLRCGTFDENNNVITAPSSCVAAAKIAEKIQATVQQSIVNNFPVAAPR